MRLMWILLLILAIPIVSATHLGEDRILYFTGDNENVDKVFGVDASKPHYVDGKNGKGFGFNSTNYMNLTLSGGDWEVDDYVDGNMTISMWLNYTNISSNQVFIGQGYDNVLNTWYIRLQNYNQIHVRFTNNTGNYDLRCNITLNSYNNNTYYHFAFAYGGTSIQKIYINAQECSDYIEQGLIQELPPSKDTTILGAWNGEVNNAVIGQYYNGTMDEVIIWNRTLSQAEITEYYNNNWTSLHNKIYFRDESSGNFIESETFDVSFSKSGYFNSTIISDYTYNFKQGLDGTYDFIVSSTNYPIRNYHDLDFYDDAPKHHIIYLINSTLGDKKTFQIIDSSFNALEDALVIFYREINGSYAIIGKEKTNYAGEFSIYLDSDYEYEIKISAEGYLTRVIKLEPDDDEYTVELQVSSGGYNQSVYEMVLYEMLPKNQVLTNGTDYDFSFSLNSTSLEITNCTLTLKNGSSTLQTANGFSANTCFLEMTQNTLDLTNITSKAEYTLDGVDYPFIFTKQYNIIYSYQGEFSLKTFLDDVSGFGEAGFDSFGRMILAFIIIFVITSLAARNLGISNAEAIIILVFVLVWFFSYVNWFYLDFSAIPDILGFNLRKYIIAIMVTLAGSGFVMEKYLT